MLLQGAREQYIGIIDATEHAKMTMHQVTHQQMIMYQSFLNGSVAGSFPVLLCPRQQIKLR